MKNSTKFLRSVTFSLFVLLPIVLTAKAENSIRAEFLTLQSSNSKNFIDILNTVPMKGSMSYLSYDSKNNFLKIFNECIFISIRSLSVNSMNYFITSGKHFFLYSVVHAFSRQLIELGNPADLLKTFLKLLFLNA